MTTRLWVTFHILQKAVLSCDKQWVSEIVPFVKGSLIIFSLWPTASEWIADFVKGSLITFFPMNNSQWVTLHILWKSVWSHLFWWPIGSEWHCTCWETQFHQIFFYDQQSVSDILDFVKGSLVTSFPREWVTLHTLWKTVLSHPSLQPAPCELHCNILWKSVPWVITSSLITNREWETLHILWKGVSSSFSYDQQRVSDITHLVEGNLITLFPMTNSLWVALYIWWKAFSPHFFLWPTACEWHCRFSLITYFHMTNSLWVIGILVEGSLITAFPMTNSVWVTLQILSKAVSSYFFLWPTGSEWQYKFCETPSFPMTNSLWE